MRDPRRPEPRRSALEALNEAERAAVLRRLLEAHPELHGEAETLASEHLVQVSSEEVAEELSWALESIPFQEMDARSGRQPGRGYVHPSEAAWELIEEAVEPFVADMQRCAELGMTEAAADVALGILAGLYECRDAEDGTVLGWAPAADATHELAAWVAQEARKVGVHLSTEAVEEACGDWAPFDIGT